MKTHILKGANGDEFVTFWCPGCDHPHGPQVAGSKKWAWNGERDKPTFSPSLLCRADYGTAAQHGSHPRGGEHVCHSFIVDGRIQFLGDCTHALAGQTVDIPDWPEDE